MTIVLNFIRIPKVLRKNRIKYKVNCASYQTHLVIVCMYYKRFLQTYNTSVEDLFDLSTSKPEEYVNFTFF
jgi:hypothetical protein